MSEKEETFYARYLYRTIGNNRLEYPPIKPAMNTERGHDLLVDFWNDRDLGKCRVWEWMRVYRGEIDYPED